MHHCTGISAREFVQYETGLSTTFGALAAFYRSRVDSIVMRLVDPLMASRASSSR
jgi:hypothetical protein